MSILDSVNSRFEVKKKQQEASQVSPLERIAKSIKEDVVISNTVLTQKNWDKWNEEHKNGVSEHAQALMAGKNRIGTSYGDKSAEGVHDIMDRHSSDEAADIIMNGKNKIKTDWGDKTREGVKSMVEAHQQEQGKKELGKAPKSTSGKGVDIGDGFTVHRHGLDANGNHSVWVSQGGGRAKKIQTNGNVPTVHREARSDGTISQAGAKEIKDYYNSYIKKSEDEAMELIQKDWASWRANHPQGSSFKSLLPASQVMGWNTEVSRHKDMYQKHINQAAQAPRGSQLHQAHMAAAQAHRVASDHASGILAGTHNPKEYNKVNMAATQASSGIRSIN